MGPHPVASGAHAPAEGSTATLSSLPCLSRRSRQRREHARAGAEGARTRPNAERASQGLAPLWRSASTRAQARRRARIGSRNRRSTRRPRARSPEYAHEHTLGDTKTRAENIGVCIGVFALLYGHIMRLSARQKPLQRPGVLGGAAPRVLPGSPQRVACCVLGPCDTMARSSGL